MAGDGARVMRIKCCVYASCRARARQRVESVGQERKLSRWHPGRCAQYAHFGTQIPTRKGRGFAESWDPDEKKLAPRALGSSQMSNKFPAPAVTPRRRRQGAEAFEKIPLHLYLPQTYKEFCEVGVVNAANFYRAAVGALLRGARRDAVGRRGAQARVQHARAAQLSLVHLARALAQIHRVRLSCGKRRWFAWISSRALCW